MMSAAQVIIALGGIIYPTLTEKMMALYGFRGKRSSKREISGNIIANRTRCISSSGTAAIMGALSLNSIVGMSLMHPVEWHAKRPEDVRAERMRRKERKFQHLSLSNRRSTIDVIRVSSIVRWSSLRSLKEDNGTEVPLLVENLKVIKFQSRDFRRTIYHLNLRKVSRFYHIADCTCSFRFTYQSTAYRVASISAIEGGIRGWTKSEFIRESLTRRTSALSANSLVNLATGLGALSDIRQLHEKKTKEWQTDKEIREKEEEQKQDAEVQQEEEKKKKK